MDSGGSVTDHEVENLIWQDILCLLATVANSCMYVYRYFICEMGREKGCEPEQCTWRRWTSEVSVTRMQAYIMLTSSPPNQSDGPHAIAGKWLRLWSVCLYGKQWTIP